jgi:hypothetical protein
MDGWVGPAQFGPHHRLIDPHLNIHSPPPTAHTPGMAPADGSHGYVEAGALDASVQNLLKAGRPGLGVRQEAGSPFLGLV